MSPSHSSSQATADGQGAQDNIDADVLPWRNSQGAANSVIQIKNIFRDLIAHRYATAAEITDTRSRRCGHEQQQNARRDNERHPAGAHTIVDSCAMLELTRTKDGAYFFENNS